MKTLSVLALSFFVISVTASASDLNDLSKNMSDLSGGNSNILNVDEFMKKAPYPKDGSGVEAFVNYFKPRIDKEGLDHAVRVAKANPLIYTEESVETAFGPQNRRKYVIPAAYCIDHKDARQVYKISDTSYILKCLAGSNKKPSYVLAYKIETNNVTQCVRDYFNKAGNRNKGRAKIFDDQISAGLICQMRSPNTRPASYGALDKEALQEYLSDKEDLRKYLGYKVKKHDNVDAASEKDDFKGLDEDVK